MKKSEKKWQKMKSTLEEFFYEKDNDGYWYHKRLDEDLESVNSSISQKSLAGQASPRARASKKQEKTQPENTTPVENITEDNLTGVEHPFNERSTNKDTDTNTDTNTEEKEKVKKEKDFSFSRDSSASFSLFVDEYPESHRIGEDEAKAIWAKTQQPDRMKIIASVAEFKNLRWQKMIAKGEENFIPNMDSFLRKKMWKAKPIAYQQNKDPFARN